MGFRGLRDSFWIYLKFCGGLFKGAYVLGGFLRLYIFIGRGRFVLVLFFFRVYFFVFF